MKAKIKKQDKCMRFLEVEVPTDVAMQGLQDVYEEIAQEAQFPGFRKGKAPMEIVKSRYSDKAREETTKRLIQHSYVKALEELDLRPVSPPQFSDIVLQENKPFTYSVQIDTYPTFKIKRYKEIPLSRKQYQIRDEDIQRVLEQIQQQQAQYIPVLEGPVQEGHVAVCDVESVVDGKPQKKQERAWLAADEKMVLPEIAKSLLGARPGDKRQVEVNFAADFANKELAGKKAAFSITVHEIKQKKLPGIDDDLARAAGDYKDLSDLKGKIRQGLEERAKAQVRADMENQAVEYLLKSTKFDLPQSLVEEQAKKLYERAIHSLKDHQGLKDEEIAKHRQELQEKAREDAQRSVKAFFILDKIAQAEGIKVPPKDVDERIELMARQYQKTPEDMRKYLEENDLMDSIIIETRERKTLEFLLDNAKIQQE